MFAELPLKPTACTESRALVLADLAGPHLTNGTHCDQKTRGVQDPIVHRPIITMRRSVIASV